MAHLEAAAGVFILGSTEPHYTPSKVYQAVLAKKPLWALRHKDSSACEVIRFTGAGILLTFQGEIDVETTVTSGLQESYLAFLEFIKSYNAASINRKAFEAYSAEEVTRVLAETLNKALSA